MIELSDASDEETDSAAAAPARDRDPLYFRRALFLLANETVEKISGELRGPKSGVFCVHAATRGKAESGLMDHLEKTLRDVYAMTKTLDHEDRDSLSGDHRRAQDGGTFSKSSGGWSRTIAAGGQPCMGNRLRVVLTPSEPLPGSLEGGDSKDGDPSADEGAVDRAGGEEREGKSRHQRRLRLEKRESAEGAPSPVTTKKAKNAVASMTTKTATEKTDEDAGGVPGDRAGDLQRSQSRRQRRHVVDRVASDRP